MANITVFCGSRNVAEIYQDAASQVGALIAKYGYTMVYGGGTDGLMGITASAAMQNGGKVIGVYPRGIEKESFASALYKTVLTDTLAGRKEKLIELSEIFITLAGGIGTLDEISELCALEMLRMKKPCQIWILNTGGFYDDIIAYFEKCVAGGFLTSREVSHWKFAKTPEEIFAAIKKI